MSSDSEHEVSRIGIAWYRRDQWEELLEASVDREELEDTYEEWLEIARNRLVEFATEGVTTQRVDVDVSELIQWCRKEGRPIDSPARAAYAAHKLWGLSRDR